jgi:pilus assembly protein Flp/PilA
MAALRLRPIERLRQEKGATAVEYAVIVALIVLVAIGSVALLGDTVTNAFDMVLNELANPPGG